MIDRCRTGSRATSCSRCGNSKVATPCGLSSTAKPATKSLMSGTWASTLLATARSACLPWRQAPRPSATPKKSSTIVDALGAGRGGGACGRLDASAGDVARLARIAEGSRHWRRLRPHGCRQSDRSAPPCRRHSARACASQLAGEAAEVGIVAHRTARRPGQSPRSAPASSVRRPARAAGNHFSGACRVCSVR